MTDVLRKVKMNHKVEQMNQNLKQEYPKKPISQAKSHRTKPRRKDILIFTREEQKRHDPFRASCWNRRWGKTSMKTIRYLSRIYTTRNSFSFKISIIATTSKDSLPKEEYIYYNNMRSAHETFQRKTPQTGKVVVFLQNSMVMVERKLKIDTGQQISAKSCQSALKSELKKTKRFFGITKNFEEFDPWDWKAWHKNKQAHFEAHTQKVIRHFRTSPFYPQSRSINRRYIDP